MENDFAKLVSSSVIPKGSMSYKMPSVKWRYFNHIFFPSHLTTTSIGPIPQNAKSYLSVELIPNQHRSQNRTELGVTHCYPNRTMLKSRSNTCHKTPKCGRWTLFLLHLTHSMLTWNSRLCTHSTNSFLPFKRSSLLPPLFEKELSVPCVLTTNLFSNKRLLERYFFVHTTNSKSLAVSAQRPYIFDTHSLLPTEGRRTSTRYYTQ